MTITPADVRRVRVALGLSKAAFGRTVGVERLAVHNWETGRFAPREQHARKIAALATRVGIKLG